VVLTAGTFFITIYKKKLSAQIKSEHPRPKREFVISFSSSKSELKQVCPEQNEKY